ncbi:BC1872 family protein [Neobacillus drentensis]|uniref:BC1872 family protein n=1 Tax=Neobacillus drentensis TaxID=220684 RepID=UPI00300127C8
MNKTDSIARRILGWKLNRWDRWYDFEKAAFIHESEFQPEQNLDHAMLIVNKLKGLGYTFKTNGETDASFNNVHATGKTLSQAITNAAYTIIENNVEDRSTIWAQLC